MDKLTEYILQKDKTQKSQLDEMDITIDGSLTGLKIAGVFALFGALTFLDDMVHFARTLFKPALRKCSAKYHSRGGDNPYFRRCLAKARMDAYIKLAKKANQQKSKCKTEKKPEICNQKIVKAVAELKLKVSKEKVKLREAETDIKKYGVTKH